MELKPEQLYYTLIMDHNSGEGRARYDSLCLEKVGDLFIVGWEDSAHHYWHSQYFTTFEEAFAIYEDYRVNGIPDDREEEEGDVLSLGQGTEFV